LEWTELADRRPVSDSHQVWEHAALAAISLYPRDDLAFDHLVLGLDGHNPPCLAIL